jgi:hypothetical protein
MASEQLKQMNELYASIKENSCGLLRDRDPSESSAGTARRSSLATKTSFLG